MNADLAERGAERILHAYETFAASFNAITARARRRFERLEFVEIQTDAKERLDLYAQVVDALVSEVRALLAEGSEDAELWAAMKDAYHECIVGSRNEELAQTFFNSMTRRIFSTVGVNPALEFVSSASALSDVTIGPGVYRRYPLDAALVDVVRRLLEDYRFDVGFEDLQRDAQRVAEATRRQLAAGSGAAALDAIEMLRAVFVRNKGAYLVGRLRSGLHVQPFVLPLLNRGRGVVVDAVLTNQNEASIVFSFARSYFLVETECPRELIVFLKSIMPLKPIAELYIALGYNKHGKTEQYRSLMRHLAKYDDRFEIAAGDRGMVMLVFTLPGVDVVFKVIQDRFAPPKNATRRDVLERYRLVFQHDRVGRLVDAQEFEHLEFPRERFTEALLGELLLHASRSAEVRGDDVVLHHLYAERRVTPLNLYLREAAAGLARKAVIDYGNAIKELAAANIFPGDFLLKNFGVTRHGRVVFYDYDELCLLEQCRFRELPRPRNPEEELSAEPWFTVGPDDIFPEEFRRFLGLPAALRQEFEERHADLFTVAFWRSMQARHVQGELLDVIPYPAVRRLDGAS